MRFILPEEEAMRENFASLASSTSQAVGRHLMENNPKRT